jgi:hypothetical protein
VPFVPDCGGQREIVGEDPRLLYDSADKTIEQIDRLLSDLASQRALRGGSFVGIVGITFSQRDHPLREAGGYVRTNRNSPAATASISRPVTSLSGDSVEPLH